MARTRFRNPNDGEYNVNNALAAMLVGKMSHIKPEAMQQALKDLFVTANRTEWMKAQNGADILSDVYNSNPTAAIEVLNSLKDIKTTGRKLIVLGDMLELGQASETLHESLASHINKEDFAKVYLVGDYMKYLRNKLSAKYETNDLFWFEKDQLEELTTKLKEELQPNDTILLKGSHGIHLENVLHELI